MCIRDSIQIAVIICFIIITVSCTLILCDAVWIIILCPFPISDSYHEIATISKELFHFTDVYVIDVHNSQDALYALLVATTSGK